MKKKPYVRSIILSFVMIYILGMLLFTFRERRQVEYKTTQEYFSSLKEVIDMHFEVVADKMLGGKEYSKDEMESVILRTISDSARYFEEIYSERYAIAAYEMNGEQIAQTTGILTLDVKDPVYCFVLDEYFSEEELDFLKQVYMDRERDKKGYSDYENKPVVWYIHAYINEETGELAKLYFTTEFKDKIEESDYETPNTDTKWSWVNPDESVLQNLIKVGESTHVSYDIHIPYYKLGEEEYDAWLKHEFLQGFPEIWKEYSVGTYEEKTLLEKRIDHVYVSYVGDERFVIKLRYVSQPLLQAMNSLKFLYVGSAIFVVGCLWIVLKNLNKYYEQRERQEITRRDFTNAMAHELKTPLGIVRGFAENSLENTNEEKREYYLKQIIGQTEEMDKLVKEMVYISKLDSEELVLTKECLCLADIVKEQLDKLKVLSDEKNLNIKMSVDGSLEVYGDKKYLERAIWNLLHNAIEYNRLEGYIKIAIDKKYLRIENSGVKISDEDLSHVFDMFYTSNKSRNFSGKHMGLGLYLAKKILELHKMNISIGNTDAGVEVVVSI